MKKTLLLLVAFSLSCFLTTACSSKSKNFDDIEITEETTEQASEESSLSTEINSEAQTDETGASEKQYSSDKNNNAATPPMDKPVNGNPTGNEVPQGSIEKPNVTPNAAFSPNEANEPNAANFSN